MLNKRRGIIALMMVAANVLCTVHLYSQEVKAAIEISGVTVGGGGVNVAVYSNERDYGEDKSIANFILDPTGKTISHELTLPAGEYVVSVFQDKNDNGKLDTGLFGIPKEPFGITNYTHGIPGKFEKLKVMVNSYQARVTVSLGKFKW